MISTDAAEAFELVGQQLSLSNKELGKEIGKHARGVGKMLVTDLKDVAPVSVAGDRWARSGTFKRTGIKLSVKRGRVYVRVFGKWGVRPTNLAYLLVKGHRDRARAMTRAEDFLNPVLDHWKTFWQSELDKAMSIALAKFERDLGKKLRSRKLRKLAP